MNSEMVFQTNCFAYVIRSATANVPIFTNMLTKAGLFQDQSKLPTGYSSLGRLFPVVMKCFIIRAKHFVNMTLRNIVLALL